MSTASSNMGASLTTCACNSNGCEMYSITKPGTALWLLFLVTLATGPVGPLAAAEVAAEVVNIPKPAPSLMRTPSVDDPVLGSSSLKENSSSSSSRSYAIGPPLPGDTLAGSSTGNSSRGSTVTAFGSKLRPGDQCGGAGGSCNTTTIGVPCGDHAWDGVTCPVYFLCTRKNISFWICEAQPDSPLRQPMHQQNASSTQQDDPDVSNNHTRVIAQDGQFTSEAAVGDGSSSSRSSRDSGATVISVCSPEQAARGLTGCSASVAPNGSVLLNNKGDLTAVSAARQAGVGELLVSLLTVPVFCAVALL